MSSQPRTDFARDDIAEILKTLPDALYEFLRGEIDGDTLIREAL